MARYTYHGPPQRLSLVTSTRKTKGVEERVFKDFAFETNREIDAPADNPVIVSMVAAGVLVEIPKPSASKGDEA